MKDPKSDTADGRRFFGPNALVVVAALVIVLAALKQAQVIVLPFIFSVFLSLLAAPFVSWLRQKRVSTLIAVALVVILMMAALTTLATVVGGLVNNFAKELNQHRDAFNELSRAFTERLREYGLEVPDDDSLDGDAAVLPQRARAAGTLDCVDGRGGRAAAPRIGGACPGRKPSGGDAEERTEEELELAGHRSLVERREPLPRDRAGWGARGASSATDSTPDCAIVVRDGLARV